jgi:malate dehydrogenase (oxaloacetate-decarboxylating)
MAALLNALQIVGKRLDDLKVIVHGVGAAGTACAEMLLAAGTTNIIGIDRTGALYPGRKAGMNPYKERFAARTNPQRFSGSLEEAMEGADLYIGLSGPGTLPLSALQRMASDAIVFALANPTPEIMPEIAEPYVRVMATGRSDYPNQINNVLAFPGVFRGALDCHATEINEEMKLAEAHAIAGTITSEELQPDYIVPSVFNRQVADAVARAVIQAAYASGVARQETEDRGTEWSEQVDLATGSYEAPPE